MNYITIAELFQYTLVLISFATLIIAIFTAKKK